MNRRSPALRSRRAAQARVNQRTKAKYVPGCCTRPYCYRPRWGVLKLCRHHTLLSRLHMQRYRDSGNANRARWRRESKRS